MAFGVLITVHELGHLIAAKKSGVRVQEFWIGMGPLLLSREIGETVYCLRLLPIGGACVMEGEDGEAVSARSFGKATRPRRFAILIAGVLMNFLTGFIIILCLTAPRAQYLSTQLDQVYAGSDLGGASGLQAGDQVLKINGYHVWQGADVSQALARGARSGAIDFVVRRDGQRVALDGLQAQPNVDLGDGRKGYGISMAVKEMTPGAVVRESFLTSLNYARLIWHSLGDLVSGTVGVDQLSGPIGVTEVMAETVRYSIVGFLNLVAFISINLGVMNLLPIPGLDGGRLLFLLIESVRRKPLDPRVEGYVNIAGMVLLFGLMIYVTGNDVMRLFS